MSKLSSTDVICHRDVLLLLLGPPHHPMDLQLMLLQLLLCRFDLAMVFTLDLLSSGHPTAFHVHLQAAVEVEDLITGFADETLLGRSFVLGFLCFFGTGTSRLVLVFARASSWDSLFTVHLLIPGFSPLPSVKRLMEIAITVLVVTSRTEQPAPSPECSYTVFPAQKQQ